MTETKNAEALEEDSHVAVMESASESEPMMGAEVIQEPVDIDHQERTAETLATSAFTKEALLIIGFICCLQTHSSLPRTLRLQ